ncbi:MAG: aminotransferase class III-fold pyridoxal phosphate-dependent enzyme, partial [Candidatus Omnitrophica bacterium]|nr:aminotransferase class III-fold pyridoxal phosphate-dependent enzyme [Candidatus Omnitrophota bacterium]
NSFDGEVFFANSGAEANEAAIKLARLYGGPDRFETISMENSFHGRTLATLTLTGQEKHRQGFEPLPEGFRTVPFNDIKAIEEAVNEKTIAIIVELIQGEGGINVASKEYIRFLRRFCSKKDILLIFDEVQTGMGRTGKMFCFQHFGIEPDMMSLSKTLGGGFPISALIAKRKLADTFTPGTHASTFGGSPLACVSSLAVFEAIKNNDLLLNAENMGEYLFERLKTLKEKFSFIKEIRGIGLMLGVELSRQGKLIVDACMKEGLLLNCTQDKVLRILPPLTVNKKDIDEGIRLLEKGFLSQL